MRAGETYVARDGYEVALFPLVALYLYQDEGVGSHVGTYNMDFHGYEWNGSSWVRQTNAPIYAPCTCRLVFQENTYSAGNIRIFQSVNPVHTPGGLRYILFYFGHDPSPPVSGVGTICNQGQLIYHTGQYGVATGDHSHTCAGEGQWVNFSTSMTNRSTGHQDLTNHIHYWDAFYVNDTTILQGKGHDWKTWDEPPVPPFQRESKFPWYIYNRKRRELWK